jgi:hypothetical protein
MSHRSPLDVTERATQRIVAGFAAGRDIDPKTE